MKMVVFWVVASCCLVAIYHAVNFFLTTRRNNLESSHVHVINTFTMLYGTILDMFFHTFCLLHDSYRFCAKTVRKHSIITEINNQISVTGVLML